MLEVRLLGSFQIKCGRKPVEIASRPAQSLFAYLILNAGTAYRREKLAGQLWPDSEEESARDYLRHALWRIRRALQAASAASYLKANDLTLSFDASLPFWLDAAALQDLDSKSSPDQIAEVLNYYAGELLPGFYDEWVSLERERLQSVYEQQMVRLLQALERQKRWGDVLQWAEKWIALGQRPEAAYRSLMSAYAAQGDMSKAAAAFECCVKSLTDFGVEPSEQTRRLYEDLKKRKPLAPASPATSAPVPSPQSSASIPVPLTSFIGREKELAEIMRLVKSQRLVTLLGPGGVGKTRLAIEASNRLLTRFHDGVYWIDLVGLSEPSLVPQAVLQGTGVRELANRSPTDMLIDHFATSQNLLVIDNCEHLIAACIELASRVLSGCRHLHILATSREALGIFGETPWTVPSLSVPKMPRLPAVSRLAKAESVRLFMERVVSVQPHFALTEQNAPAVVQICKRLDGIPLAIELAAARARMMSVDEIAGRLDRSFDLLNAGNRSALPRHQTLRATIDWSHELLTEPERILFRRLAPFAGGFTLSAVEKVCDFPGLKQSHILGLLGRLVDKSLVGVDAKSKAGETHYRLLETLREYARERLMEAGEEQAGLDQHMAYFTQLAVEAESGLLGAEILAWVQRLEMEHENLLAAIDWSLRSSKAEFALRIVGCLLPWDAWHNSEGAELSLQVVQSPLTSRPTSLRAKALCTAAIMQLFQGNRQLVHSLLLEALEIAKQSGDKETYILALMILGQAAALESESRAARTYLEEAVNEARKFGAPSSAMIGFSMGSSLSFLGDVFMAQGDSERAQQAYEEGVLQLRAIHNKGLLAYPLRRLGVLALDRKQYDAAAAFYRESLLLNLEETDLRAVMACVAGFAAIATARGQSLVAARLYGAVEARLAKISASLLPTDQRVHDHNVAMLHTKLNQTSFKTAWAKGRAMTMQEAIDFALHSA